MTSHPETTLLRRRSCLAAAGSLWLCGCTGPAQRRPATPSFGGCTVSAGEMARRTDRPGMTWGRIDVEDPVVPASGIPLFDRALGRQLVRLSRSFGVRPGFAYVDDIGSRNAMASPFTRFPGTQGTVLFGIRFMREVLARGEGSDIGVLGICAHEFAHVSQFHNGWYERLASRHATAKLYELHADLLAGFFVGQTRQLRPHIVTRGFEALFHSLGTREPLDPDFHGTPEERLAAVQEGLRTADRGLGFAAATQEGARHVLARFA